MRVLSKKYIFHIPLYEYDGRELVAIDMDGLLDDLIFRLGEASFDSLYITKVESHYKARSFDELLLTIFVENNECLEEIFKKWFRDNNDVLQQDEFAYECGNELFIEKLER